MENQHQENQQQELTQEQLEQQQLELGTFYDKQSEFLEKKKKYLGLLADIDELTFKRVRIQQAFAQMMYEQEQGGQIPDVPEMSETEAPQSSQPKKDHSKGFRKLKTTK
jgi:hypothetical protein